MIAIAVDDEILMLGALVAAIKKTAKTYLEETPPFHNPRSVMITSTPKEIGSKIDPR